MKLPFVLLTMVPLSKCFQPLGRTVTVGSRPFILFELNAKRSKATNPPRTGEFWRAEMDCWRPTVNDVERISWGKPAKKKGTGSRGVPHRLNEEERFLFDQARRKGFLEVAGSGWRSQRREAPLLNSYRSLCDARGQASIVIHKSKDGADELVVDISPLRVPEEFESIANACQGKFEGSTIYFQDGSTASEESKVEHEFQSDNVLESWMTRPIYQLPPYCLVWQLERSSAKACAKEMAKLFCTTEDKKAPSKKPVGVKPGKGRRHGGYGI
mmetsp:Transcript_79921/g.232002  ORF Transcript_79921/g.232002 Transcript_79921/m.232002 type:complete len:270 (-) Transcript_79921:162-971(-)